MTASAAIDAAVEAAPRIIRVRHEQPPNPLSCRWCGADPRDHAMSWVPGHGWHGWEDPTQAQIHARMRAKRGIA